MFKQLTILASVLTLNAVASPADAQQRNCGPRADIVKVLSQKYQEQHQASGLQSAAAMVEIWASEGSGSWTILVTHANGTSCIVASGQSWLEHEAVSLVEEVPS
ncbi:MAG: hypothetical protein AAGC92_13760 [Pseudomonadota bacterium]